LQANSRPVSSNQRHTHPRLPEVVQRHLARPSRKPIAAHNRTAFAALAERMARSPRPLVLDSFCGTGASTARLAAQHPELLVVGIDKSAHRLQRHRDFGVDNYLLLQAECEDIWHLVREQGWTVAHHYLFYPNPWPKSAQLQRRVHGHPAFPTLLRLGGTVELRSNWLLYVEEFGLAMTLGGGAGCVQRCAVDVPPITLFEHKYRASGHDLWRYRGRCPAP
jgi:tRNA (guanine-N7-)-methyltransferase